MKIEPEKLHELLVYCVDFAQAMLQDSGEFYPFGAVIASDGEFKAVGGYDGEEHPFSQDIYKLLLDSFKKQAQSGDIMATAIACNVDIPTEYSPPYPDGIRVSLECVGYSRNIYIPYKLNKKGFFKKKNEILLNEPIPVEVDAQLFEKISNA